MNSNPIGIFDSGAGGLSVLKEIVNVCPSESVVYFADSQNCPYGPKLPESIIELSTKIVNFLLEKHCKLIVVACNTATAAAIDFLRSNYKLPFVGMEPAIKPASLNSKTKSIGVLATAGTFKGKLYIETSRKYASDVDVHYQVGEGLVELVENDMTESEQAEKLIRKYVVPMVEQNIDHLVLGCTHYPFLSQTIEKVIPPTVTLIDPAPSVAKQCANLLQEHNLLNDSTNKPTYHFYSSGNSYILKQIVQKRIPTIDSQMASFNSFTTI